MLLKIFLHIRSNYLYLDNQFVTLYDHQSAKCKILFKLVSGCSIENSINFENVYFNFNFYVIQLF